MSYWSTLKNVFRECGAPETRYTISIGWADGSGIFDYPVSLPEAAANMLLAGRAPERVAISKFSGPPSATGGESGERVWLCHLSCSPLETKLATDGSYEERLRAYYRGRGIPSIFADLSLSRFTRARGPASS